MVNGAAFGVKHPTPSPAQHHPSCSPREKGRKIPPSPTSPPHPPLYLQLPPGDPPGRPAPMRGGPPSLPSDDLHPPRPRGQRCRRRSRLRAARRWGQRRVGRGAVAARCPRVPAALRSPLRRPLPAAGRGLGRAAPPRAAGGGGEGGGVGGGRLHPKARSLFLLAGVLTVRPTEPPKSCPQDAALGGSPPWKRLFHPGVPQNSTRRDGKGFGCLIPKGLAMMDPKRLHGTAPIVFSFIRSHRPPLNGEVWKSSIPRATWACIHT